MGVRESLELVAAIGLVAAGTLNSAAAARPAPQPGADSSQYRAGYAVTPQVARSVFASWRQPKATCTQQTTYSIFRIALSRSSGNVQIGTAADCHDGQATYHLWQKFHGDPKQMVRIHAGDLMKVSMKMFTRSVEYRIEDVTAGWGLGGVGDGQFILTTRASVGVSARGSKNGALPLTDFGKVVFMHCKVDRQSMAGQGPIPLVMKTEQGLVKARPSKFSDDDFTVTWLHH